MALKICTGVGGYDTRKEDQLPYNTLSPQQVWDMVANPVSLPKEQAPWIIPSGYHAWDARKFEVQREHGKYDTFLCWDIDKGSPSLQQLAVAVRAVVGPGVAFAIYSSKSSKPDYYKWRILIPIAEPLNGFGYYAFQLTFFDMLAEQGITADYALCRSAQLVYLPNRGEHYEYHYEPGGLLTLSTHLAAVKAAQVERLSIDMTSQHAKSETSRSIIGAFRRKHSMGSLLRLYGFDTLNGTNWRNPFSDSGSYGGFKVFEDQQGWFSSSSGFCAMPIGKPAPGGGRYGDAFDLYIYFNCGGDRAAAELYAKQCLAEEDELRYGEATVEHGRLIFETLYASGQPLGPKAHLTALEAARARAEILEVHAAEQLSPGEWQIDFPPSILGEVAKTIYNASSRPIKQYSIALALHLAAGICGARYNTKGFGLNLSLVIAGDSGTGKGEARRIEQDIYMAMGHKIQNMQGVLEVFGHAAPPSAEGARQMFSSDYQSRATYTEDADAQLELLMQAAPGSNGDKLRAKESELWDNSGAGRVIGAVTYSKKENKVEAVISPALTIGRDLQVDALRSYLGARTTMRGHGPRQVYAVYEGPKSKPDRSRNREIPDWLIDILGRLWQSVYAMTGDTVIEVVFDEEADKAFYKYEDDMLDHMDQHKCEIVNRAHMNAARIASIVAVLHNPHAPVVTKEIFAWARSFVSEGYNNVFKMIMSGDVGSGEAVRVRRAIKVIIDYTKMPPGRREMYKVPKSLAGVGSVITDRYLIAKLKASADFKGSDTAATGEDLIRKTIIELERQDYIHETTPAAVTEKYGALLAPQMRQKIYMIGDSLLDEIAEDTYKRMG